MRNRFMVAVWLLAVLVSVVPVAAQGTSDPPSASPPAAIGGAPGNAPKIAVHPWWALNLQEAWHQYQIGQAGGPAIWESTIRDCRPDLIDNDGSVKLKTATLEAPPYALRELGYACGPSGALGASPQRQLADVQWALDSQRETISFSVVLGARYKFQITLRDYQFKLYTSDGKTLAPRTVFRNYSNDSIMSDWASANLKPEFPLYDGTGRPNVTTETTWLCLWIYPRYGRETGRLLWTISPPNQAPKMAADRAPESP